MRYTAQFLRKSNWNRSVVIAAICLAALVLTAESRPGVRDPVTLGKHAVAAADSCDSVFVWSRVGWAVQPYRGALRQFDPDVEFPRSYLTMTLNEVGAAIRFDGPVDFSVLAEHPTDSITYDFMPVGGIGSFGVHGLYGFLYQADGKLIQPRVLVSSLSDRVDSAIMRAVRIASDSGSLLPLPASVPSGAVELRLTLGNWLQRDSLAVTGPLFRVRQPVFDQVTYPELGEKHSTAPRYPSEALSVEMEGEVDVAMVVRPDGSIDPRSILIPRATATPFVRQVLDALPKNRYKVARVAGCPVAAIVTQPFAFTIAR